MFSTTRALLFATMATVAPSLVFGSAKFSALIPNGEALGRSLGHGDKGYTEFGKMFSEKGKTWAGVCKEKWPGQTVVTVGAVLGDPCCKWTAGKPDFELSAPFLGGKTCATEAKTPAAAAPTTAPAAASAAPVPAATTAKPVAPGPAPQAPGKMQPTQPAPGGGNPAPVPAQTRMPVPGSGKPSGNSTVPAMPVPAPPTTPANSKPVGKPSGSAHKLCK